MADRSVLLFRGTGRNPRYLAMQCFTCETVDMSVQERRACGLRPFRWTDEIDDAMTFVGSINPDIVRERVGHMDFEIIPYHEAHQRTLKQR